MKPDLRFLFSHPAHLIALGFGSGLPPKAPGTFGTLFGWVTYVLLAPHLTSLGWAIAFIAGFALGCWVCLKTGRDLGAADHGAMVWDEIIAIWLVLLFTPWGWLWQLVAFGVFRFFDIVKPPPIRRFERRFKSGNLAGLGVMGDDLIAAFYSLLTMAVAIQIVERIAARR
jgi:phosphatidylglycerophosphatase A